MERATATDRKTLLLNAATETNLKCSALSDSVRLESYRLYDSVYLMFREGVNIATGNRLGRPGTEGGEKPTTKGAGSLGVTALVRTTL